MLGIRVSGTIILVLLVGCATAERKLVHPEAWTEPHEGVAVLKGGLRIGSKTFDLPTTEAGLSDVLGSPDRTVGEANRILVWDRLGIFAYQDLKSHSIDALSISFTCEEADFCPKHAFPGVLVVGNAVFWHAPDARDIVRNHFRADELACYRNVGRYEVSVDCMAAGPGLGTFEIALK